MRKPAKEQSLAILRDRGVPIGTVLDVGVQNHTPELIRAFPDKKHVLFEPVAEYATSIHQHYSSLNYELYEMAVGENVGNFQLELRSMVKGQHFTHSSIVSDGTSSQFATERRSIGVTSLDAFLADKNFIEPYLLKIDIDGGELAVLAGAKETLSKCSVVIVETPKSQIAERISAVKSSGFELFDLSEPVYYDSAFWQCDAVFIRSDLHRSCFRQLAVDFDATLYVPFR